MRQIGVVIIVTLCIPPVLEISAVLPHPALASGTRSLGSGKVGRSRRPDEQTLINSAVYAHVSAQALRKRADASPNDTVLGDRVRAAYQQAASAYVAYLAAFPFSANTNEMRYSCGHVLYRAGRLVDAAEQFARVRDERQDPRFRLEAAQMAAHVLERHIRETPTPTKDEREMLIKATEALNSTRKEMGGAGVKRP